MVIPGRNPIPEQYVPLKMGSLPGSQSRLALVSLVNENHSHGTEESSYPPSWGLPRLTEIL